MLNNKTIGILGLGKSGLSVYKFLKSNYNVKIFLYDDNIKDISNLPIDSNDFIDIVDWDFAHIDTVICSPGISLDYPKEHYIKQKSKEYGFEIICDIELFIRLYPNKKYVAITGTNGKSTTTALINHIFQSVNLNSTYAGNIGLPIFDLKEDFDIIVLELSSYQLDLMTYNSFECALLLNIEPDHLEHHGSFSNYIKAKNKIFIGKNYPKYSIISYEYKHLVELDDRSNIITISNSKDNDSSIYYLDYLYENGIKILDFTELTYLKGEHNKQNIAFAYICSKIMGVDINSITDVIKTFKGLKHRKNIVAKINKTTFINDSKATNFESTQQALKTFDNIYLILGGINKTDNLDPILSLIKSKVIKVLLIGKSTDLFSKILEENKIDYEKCNNLADATTKAKLIADNSNKETIVLLSPACASFDEFKNFEHRGDEFIKIVEDLSK